MENSPLVQLWKNTQEELRVVLAPAVFQTFVSKTQLVSLENSQAIVACPNSYLVDINHKRYHDLFKNALDNQTKTNNQITFILQDTPKTNPPTSISAPLFTYQDHPRPTTSNLHPKYTLDKFIVGNSNNFAFAAAQGIIKNPGLSYNPFFIWGGVGVGKTHLMQAVGHELLRLYPSLKIKYFPAETFGNELISALRTKSMNQFKDRYRQLDCILVDDIQFIAGKEYIQEEFFHTFNALHMNGKQVILTSDRKPNEIDHLEDRLVSRFMGGLTVDIQSPDFEMRLAIINEKTKEKGIDITPEASSYIASNTDSNTRDLEGKIQEIVVLSSSQKFSTIDLEFVQRFFNPTSTTPNLSSSSSNLNPRHLISVCAHHFDVKTGDLCGKSRKKELVYARHITAYLLLTETKLPLEEVGRLLGGRDHTSIMHARDKIHTDLSTNQQLRTLLNQIKNATP